MAANKKAVAGRVNVVTYNFDINLIVNGEAGGRGQTKTTPPKIGTRKAPPPNKKQAVLPKRRTAEVIFKPNKSAYVRVSSTEIQPADISPNHLVGYGTKYGKNSIKTVLYEGQLVRVDLWDQIDSTRRSVNEEKKLRPVTDEQALENNTSTVGYVGTFFWIVQRTESVFTFPSGHTITVDGSKVSSGVVLSLGFPPSKEKIAEEDARIFTPQDDVLSILPSKNQFLKDRRCLVTEKNLVLDRHFSAGLILEVRMKNDAVVYDIVFSGQRKHTVYPKKVSRDSEFFTYSANMDIGYHVPMMQKYAGFPDDALVDGSIREVTAEVECTEIGNVSFRGYTLRRNHLHVFRKLYNHVCRLALRFADMTESEFMNGKGNTAQRARVLALAILCIVWTKKYNSDTVISEGGTPMPNDTWRILSDSIIHEIGGDCEDFSLTCYHLWKKLADFDWSRVPDAERGRMQKEPFFAMTQLARCYTIAIELIGMNSSLIPEEALTDNDLAAHCICVAYPLKDKSGSLPHLFLDGTNFIEPVRTDAGLKLLGDEGELDRIGVTSRAVISPDTSVPGKAAMYELFISSVSDGVQQVHVSEKDGVQETGVFFSQLGTSSRQKMTEPMDENTVPALLPRDVIGCTQSSVDYTKIPPLRSISKLQTWDVDVPAEGMIPITTKGCIIFKEM